MRSKYEDLSQVEQLINASKKIILENQHSGGAYLASPNFNSYQYSWFRDGSFIAYAMNLCGEDESAAKFHTWAAETVLRRVPLIENVVNKQKQGILPEPSELLHTRYTVNGDDAVTEEWPNFQLDGFGTWLWSLNQHRLISNSFLPQAWFEAAEWIGKYLQILWRKPCYDCWEEFPEDIHTHTLAAIYGGFRAMVEMGFHDYERDAKQVKSFILENCQYDGYFVKFIGSYTVDASLLGLALPYNVVPISDERFIHTVERIEKSLLKEGGIQRYPTDTYFGGGEWILLTAWLGWYYCESGQIEKAYTCREWIQNQADEKLGLPEQVPCVLNDPNYYYPWVRKWGEIAKPLLWSHANLIILDHAIQQNTKTG